MSSSARFLPFLAMVSLVAYLGAMTQAGDWYYSLDMPPWTPPGWLFAPVWALLYLAMALAAWIVWESGDSFRGRALAWWVAQLMLNATWPWLFFESHRLGWAFGWLVMLLVALAFTYDRFRQIRARAAYLLIPYMVWLSFALLLNLVLWQRNGGGLAFIMGVSG